MRIAIIVLAVAAVFAAGAQAQTPVPSKAEARMYQKGFDIPAGIPHGTWDFDEWPGVDHPVVYKQEFMYNSTPNEKIKIDYFLSVFDADDHEGYLKTPAVLRDRGIADMSALIKARTARNKTLLGIFCHPDDEVFLAGGLLAYAAANGWTVKVVLISNGADGSQGQTDTPSQALAGYNSFGVMADGSTVVKNDVQGEKKLDIIAGYARSLGVDIQVLPIDLTVSGKHIVQVGEAPGLDFPATFGPGTEYRRAIAASLRTLLNEVKPGIVVGHGKDGEYGNYLHKMAHDLVLDAVKAHATSNPGVSLFTGFPEYNYRDNITHFLDLNLDNGAAWKKKYEAFKGITFLYKEGNDYDKPWDPTDQYMDGSFVKDYGFTPETGEPPRYEFFQRVSF